MYSYFSSQVLLKNATTLGIGGPARYYIEVREIIEMQRAIRFCYFNKLPYFILGKGSNCLFADSGFDGLVIVNKIDFCHEVKPFSFWAGAGYSFSLLSTQTSKRGLSGLEFAAGIPASVGGAVYMNAGAGGYEISKSLESVDFIDETGVLRRLEKEKLKFGYRTSPFQKMKGVIIAATFVLKPSSEALLLQQKLLEHRLKTQPYHEKSAGCIFQNPKTVAAGALVEKCGLKGKRIGDAEVSSMHANFLVNKGHASSEDMLGLIDHVKKVVQEETGYSLKQELCVIDEEAN